MVVSKLIGMIGIYYIVHFIFSYSLIATGVTQYPLSSRDPYWKFVVGFNPETTGGFSFPDHKLVFNIRLERNVSKLKNSSLKKELLIKDNYYCYSKINLKLCGEIMTQPFIGD